MGPATPKRNTLYLHFFDWPRGPFRLNGLKSRVSACAFWRTAGSAGVCRGARQGGRSGHPRDQAAPPRPGPHISVVAIETAGPVDVDASLQQQRGGIITLPAHAAEMHPADYWGTMRIGQGGCMSDWYSTDNRLAWRFRVLEPGRFDVLLLTKSVSHDGWLGGHRVQVAVAAAGSPGRSRPRRRRATAPALSAVHQPRRRR